MHRTKLFRYQWGMGHSDYVNKSNHINERNGRTWIETKKNVDSLRFFCSFFPPEMLCLITVASVAVTMLEKRKTGGKIVPEKPAFKTTMKTTKWNSVIGKHLEWQGRSVRAKASEICYLKIATSETHCQSNIYMKWVYFYHPVHCRHLIVVFWLCLPFVILIQN